MKALLKPVEMLLRGVNRARRGLYHRGLLRGNALLRPVISIGNRGYGGSGKTPATVAIARGLQSRGLRVAILTRGYGRSGDEQGVLVTRADAERFGDEPVLLWRSLQGVDVIVGADRYDSGRRYLERKDCDVFLLDDGFQHLQLHRDIDIVIESRSRWLREGDRALDDADIVLVREGNCPEFLHAPCFRLTLRALAWLDRGNRRDISALRGVSLVAFAGLADNRQFFDELERLGATVLQRVEFRDHHRYSSSDLERIVALAEHERAAAIVTTAKDHVKIERPDIGVLEVEAAIEGGEELFDLLVSEIENIARG